MAPNELLNILIVDDNPGNRVALSAALTGHGQRVVCAESGAAALRLMLDEDFAFVLLDVNMPGMNGFEVARLMRQIKRLRDTPLVLMSATYNEDADQFTGYEAGAIDFIVTPVSPVLLRSKVAALVRQCRLQQALRRQTEEVRAANESLEQQIRERQRVEARLVESKRLLETLNAQVTAASRNKSAFITHLSHELRTPLNAILGFTATLLMRLPGPLTEEQTKQLQTIRNSARHLLAMVTELLDLARIEAGKAQLRPEPVVCSHVLDEVAASLAPMAAAKGLAFEVSSASSLQMVTDRRALLQILLNLGNNAIKFTAAGGVRMEVSGEGAGAVQFRVSDTGPGISAENQLRLFQPFERVNDLAGQEGTGLGLHICQTLAAVIGARLTLESEVGKGSTFHLTVPTQWSSIAEAPPTAPGDRTRFTSAGRNATGGESGRLEPADGIVEAISQSPGTSEALEVALRAAQAS